MKKLPITAAPSNPFAWLHKDYRIIRAFIRELFNMVCVIPANTDNLHTIRGLFRNVTQRSAEIHGEIITIYYLTSVVSVWLILSWYTTGNRHLEAIRNNLAPAP